MCLSNHHFLYYEGFSKKKKEEEEEEEMAHSFNYSHCHMRLHIPLNKIIHLYVRTHMFFDVLSIYPGAKEKGIIGDRIKWEIDGESYCYSYKGCGLYHGENTHIHGERQY
jgi:hypothetical protein